MAYRLPYRLSRRTVLRGLLSAGAFGVTAQLGAACSHYTHDASSPDNATRFDATGSSDRSITVGFIYEGAKTDLGYNQSHAQALADMAAQFPDIKIVEQASVPETAAVQETIRNMVEQDEATVIFPTSYGYLDPHVLKLATEFPEVQFLHPNQMLDEGYPPNVGTYFSYLVEPAYLAGMVAGGMTQSNILGLVMPKPIPAVMQEVNSFVLGARSMNGDITARAIITGGWNLPIKEAEATNSLIDQGADVVLPRGDNAKVVAAIAKNRGCYYCGFHLNQANLAPGHFLTGIEWNWKTIYQDYAAMLLAGKTLMNGGIPRTVMGGLKENFAKISPFGTRVSDDIQKRVAAAKEKLIRNELIVFAEGTKDNLGNVVIAEGDAYTLGDPRLNAIDWFVEGIKASAFE